MATGLMKSLMRSMATAILLAIGGMGAAAALAEDTVQTPLDAQAAFREGADGSPGPSSSIASPVLEPAAVERSNAEALVNQPCDACPAWTPACGCSPDGGLTFQWAPDRWCNISPQIRTSFNSVSPDSVP